MSATTHPAVSFVIPCYNLAAFLPACVRSIQMQSFQDWEILIMDDCSSDNTPEVATGFGDERIRYVRNDPNLGHLKNYNKGISLTRGRYIWLISPDDTLRKPYVLEKYVQALEEHPQVGFAFCAIVKVNQDGVETVQAMKDQPDTIFRGPELARKLAHFNFIASPEVLARRSCYESAGLFPLDLPFAGDWYLWCRFSLQNGAAYFAEPMVNYAVHDGSMTSLMSAGKVAQCASDVIAVPWRIRAAAAAAGDGATAESCLDGLRGLYIEHLFGKEYRGVRYTMTMEEAAGSIRRQAAHPAEARRFTGRLLARYGDECYWKGLYETAGGAYRQSICEGQWNFGVLAKYLLVRMGALGIQLRGGALAARRSAQKA
ncbi:MAG: glycosyltransferase [Bryobacterales bacterium]|nr:glycosyltransferase [Bryobacterales bacterium]